jgi:hypothetical protein
MYCPVLGGNLILLIPGCGFKNNSQSQRTTGSWFFNKESENQRTTSFGYFYNLKETLSVVNEPTKNGWSYRQLLDFFNILENHGLYIWKLDFFYFSESTIMNLKNPLIPCGGLVQFQIPTQHV